MSSDEFRLKTFRGGGKTRSLIVRSADEKIVVPAELQKAITQWYHTTLSHPGETRTEATIKQNFYWKNLRQTVHEVCTKCPTCQRTKRSSKKYGHVPEKLAEVTPWEKLCVDLIGPYSMKKYKVIDPETKEEKQQTLTLWCVTMIDPATGWMEIKEIKTKEALHVADLVEQAWLTRYPWPQEIIFDQGTEFMGDFARMVEKDYGIKRRGATVRNPQANSIIERAHQTIGNIVRTFELHSEELTQDNPWDGILAAVMFAMRATYHTTLQATPTQLVFGRDAILNTKFEADWHMIRERKQKQIRRNVERENSKRIPHTYREGDQVMTLIDSKSKFGTYSYDGPYPILRINDNGSVQIRKGIYIETINIRQLKPYRN